MAYDINQHQSHSQIKKMTSKQYLKLHPEKFVMVTHEFGEPIYIAPLKNLKVQVTPEKAEAEQWSALDNTPTKLSYHAACTGYKGLQFQQI